VAGGQHEVGRSLLGKTAGVPGVVAANIGKLALAAMAFDTMIRVWNMTMAPKQYEELPESVKKRTVFVMPGRTPDGGIIYFPRIGAFMDAAETFGLYEYGNHFADYMDNKISLKQMAKNIAAETGKAAMNRIVGGGRPLYKAITELGSRRSFFPDYFNPTTIRDRGEYLARFLNFGPEYRLIMGKPRRPYWRDRILNTMIYAYDPEEAGYRDIISAAVKWNKERGKISEGRFSMATRRPRLNISICILSSSRPGRRPYRISGTRCEG